MNAAIWQPPRLRIGTEEKERRATWLELVYDLVFVVAVAELAHRVEADPTPAGLLGFVALYVPIWWAWIGQTLYVNRFDTDDAGHRLVTGLLLVIVAALAATVGHALEEQSAHFAFAFAAVRGILVAEYLMAGRHNPSARPLTTRYATGFALGAALWLASALVPTPARFALWALAVLIEYSTPLLSRRAIASLPPQPQHLPERMGLFTIIVLGESVTSIVAGLEHEALAPGALMVAALGVVVVLSLWWLYFENIEDSVVLRTYVRSQIWFYGHLPLMMAVTAFGVGIERLILAASAGAVPAFDRWLVCGAFAVSLLTQALLHVVESDQREAATHAVGAAVVLGLAMVGATLPPIGLALGLAVVAVSQVAVDLWQSTLETPAETGAVLSETDHRVAGRPDRSAELERPA